MTQQRYHITKNDYYKVRRTIRKVGGEFMSLPYFPFTSRLKIAHIANADVIYNGDNELVIVARNLHTIQKVHSRLEKKSKIKLNLENRVG